MARLMNQRTQTMAKAAPSQSHPSRGIGLWAALHLVAIAVFVLLALGQARAEASQTVTQNVAEQAVQRFAQNCFSPFLTADLAQERLAMDEVRIDFYDLRPFSNVEFPLPLVVQSPLEPTVVAKLLSMAPLRRWLLRLRLAVWLRKAS